jgi:hypothetical protein
LTCPSWTSWFNVSTRKLRRAMRLPEGDLPVIAGDGTSKSDQHQVVADVQPVDLDEHQVHGPAAKPILGLCRRPGRQRNFMAVVTAHPRAMHGSSTT